MSLSQGGLSAVIGPLRDLTVGRLLDALSTALEQGGTVRQEPMLRDKARRILRNGRLHLPQRADFEIRRDGQTETRVLPEGPKLQFDPVEVRRPDGLIVQVEPFSWDAARILVADPDRTLNYSPIRRWFLEAFQSRYGELAPDLDGAVHRLSGPERRGDGWLFEVDLGSAPVGSFIEMVDAFARAGARRLVISADPAGRGA